MSEETEHKEKMKQLQAEQRKKVKANNTKRGVVICNTGDGKGKSTAAFGTVLRAVGYGFKVGVVQFIKGTWDTGEQKMFERLDEVTHIVSGDGFTWNTQDKQKDIESAEKGLAQAVELIEAARADEKAFKLIVLDEINVALSMGYLDAQKVAEILLKKPENLNIMVTGRGAPQQVMDAADTVTEMKPLKHAFDNGILAVQGIEY